MNVGVFNQYQTAESWAHAMLVHRAEKAPPKGDVHVFGVLVVAVFDDGRLLPHLLNANGADSI